MIVVQDTMTCALEGCDVPIVRPQDRGGRLKRYCCDAHRAQARRQRLKGNRGGEEEGATRAVEALRHATALVEQALAEGSPRFDAQVAEARAQATAQVLEAQRLAALATRERLAARRNLEEERARTEEALAAAREREGHDRAVIAELRLALAEARAQAESTRAELEATRAELEEELLRHHRDVQALQESCARREDPQEGKAP